MHNGSGFLLALASVLVCTACFDPTFAWRVDKEFREHGPIVISPYSGKDRLNGKPGFVITVRPKDAEEWRAPNSAQFRRLVNEKVAYEESILGHKLCPQGYEIVEGRGLNYHGMYVDYDAECKEQRAYSNDDLVKIVLSLEALVGRWQTENAKLRTTAREVEGYVIELLRRAEAKKSLTTRGTAIEDAQINVLQRILTKIGVA